MKHTHLSAIAVVHGGSLVLPAKVTGGSLYCGAFANAPVVSGIKVPVVIFLHGSSGLALAAITEWQTWLASMEIASFAPDSFALTDRVTYTSPAAKVEYEKVHALRTSEISLALKAIDSASWADHDRLILAGTSEGGPAVARYRGDDFIAKIIYSWSCENNYYVEEHGTYVSPDQHVLNVMSSTDMYFSPCNEWLGNPEAKGHCADTFKDHTKTTVVLIPGAPHTLLNLEQTQSATANFLEKVIGKNLRSCSPISHIA